MDERHAELAHWLGQKKTTERAREEAKENLELWFKRAKFAVDKDELELARAATERAKFYQEEFRKVTARLIEIESALEKLRAEKVVPNQEEFQAAQARAEHAAGEFAKMGIEPKFAAIDPAFGVVRPPDAEGDSTAPPPTDEPAPPTDPTLSDALAEADSLLDEPLEPTEDP